MNRDEIINRFPLVEWMQDRGIVFRRKGKSLITNVCPQQAHKAGHFCVTVDTEKQVWHCNDCDTGGSVIDWVMYSEGLDVKSAMEKIGGHDEAPHTPTKPPTCFVEQESNLVASYDYTDVNGKLIFQVCRYNPKSFRQRRPDKGGWTWNLEGVKRPLYNLPGIRAADFVWVVEGEKDADALIKRGVCATTNAGGAKKWEPSYTETLKGKDVIICGDTDDAGEEHNELVFQAIKNKARSVRRLTLPSLFYKDVSDFLEKESIEELKEMASKIEPLFHGNPVPVQTMAEMEEEYRKFVKRANTTSLDLSRWLPSFRNFRPLVPGELMTIICDTGVGKSACAYSLALKSGIETLIFQLELPNTTSFERFISMVTKQEAKEIHRYYEEGSSVDCAKYNVLNNISVCSQSRMTTADVERNIEGCGVKTGRRPVFVVIDYVQLLRGEGKSRYESMTNVAEELKIIAKQTNVIMLITSQVSRKEGQTINLHDAKDSGQIENSSALVIGGWRDEKDPHRKMILQVLKNTNGLSGKRITCRIPDSLLIEEEVPLKDRQPGLKI